MIAADDVIADRYAIVREAGQGGMGVVFEAVDRRTGQRVAVKLLHRRGRDEGRFIRESQVLAALEHPHIARFVDRGVLPNGDLFLVMEWLQGETLQQRLDRGPLRVEDALRIGEQIAAALAAVHDAGVVHRDLKPSNIFLEHGSLERVKLLDFGIARRQEGTLLTAADDVIGTPGYMAPEQILASGEVTPRTDVYALGCILFRAISGRLPHQGESSQELIVRAATEPAPRLASVFAGVPPAVDEALAVMLAARPVDRPTDARRVLELLRAARSGRVGNDSPQRSRFAPPRWAVAIMVLVPIVAVLVTIRVVASSEPDDTSEDRPRSSERREQPTKPVPCPALSRCVASGIKPPRMHIDDLYDALRAVARRELGEGLVVVTYQVQAFKADLTGATDYALLGAMGEDGHYMFSGSGAEVAIRRIAPRSGGSLFDQRCAPSVLVASTLGSVRTARSVDIQIAEPGTRKVGFFGIDGEVSATKTEVATDTCP